MQRAGGAIACPVLDCARHRTLGFGRISHLAEHLREQHRVGFNGLERWKLEQLGLVVCADCDNPYVRLNSSHRCRGRRDPLGGDGFDDVVWDPQRAPWAVVDTISLRTIFGRRFRTSIRTSHSVKVWAGLSDILNKLGRLAADETGSPEDRRRAWTVFFLLPGWLLRTEEHDLDVTRTFVLARRLQKFAQGRWEELEREAAEGCARRRHTHISQQEREVERINALVSLGQLSKAYQSHAERVPLLPLSPQVLREAAAQFPPPQVGEYEGVVLEEGRLRAVREELCAEEEVVERAAKGMDEAGAGGSSSMRPSFIRDAVKRGGLEGIAALTQEAIRGNIPPELMRYVAGGHLSVLGKTDEEGKLIGQRNVVPAEGILHLAGRVMEAVDGGATAKRLAPHGLGCRVSGGAQLVPLAAELALEANPDWVVYKTDAQNGYGTVCRRKIREQLIKRGLEHRVPLFDAKYGQSILVCAHNEDGSVEWLEVTGGVVIGDAEAPVYFSVGIQPALEATAQDPDVTSSTVLGILDDVVIIGPPEEVAVGARTLQAHLTRSGLREKVSKRAVYSRTPDSLERFRWPQDAFQVHTISHVGIILVGTPLTVGVGGGRGRASFCRPLS